MREMQHRNAANLETSCCHDRRPVAAPGHSEVAGRGTPLLPEAWASEPVNALPQTREHVMLLASLCTMLPRYSAQLLGGDAPLAKVRSLRIAVWLANVSRRVYHAAGPTR